MPLVCHSCPSYYQTTGSAILAMAGGQACNPFNGFREWSESTTKPNQVKHGLEPNCKRVSADKMKEQFWSKGWALQRNGTKSNQKNWRGLNVESKPTINACCSPPQDATFQRWR